MNGNSKRDVEQKIQDYCSEEYASSIERREQHNPARESLRSSLRPNKDMIIITDEDKEAAIAKESEVIVVDSNNSRNSKELFDVLASTNWPTDAAPICSILNTRDSNWKNTAAHNDTIKRINSGTTTTYSSSTLRNIRRNKSPNPVSHFMSTKTKENRYSLDSSDKYFGGDLNSSGESRKSNDGEPHYNNMSMHGGKYEEENQFEEVNEIDGSELGLGSVIKVELSSRKLNGVIKWIGRKVLEPYDTLVGVELFDDVPDLTENFKNEHYSGRNYFSCPPGRQAVYVAPSKCTLDTRFLNNDVEPVDQVASVVRERDREVNPSNLFGEVDCPIVPGRYPPRQFNKANDIEVVCGKFKGIQGHYNSCYLDATLFAMFAFTHVFDSILYRPRESKDPKGYEEVQKVLLEEIVNPLRKNLYVRADRVMHLRKLLDKLSSVTGLMTEEKDPEEFLNSLLTQIMRAEPFLKLNSGQDAFYYQLFVEKDERLKFPTVQRLFEQSFYASDIKLLEVPSCLIIQMPRFGKDFKMYPRIMPSLYLDVTNIIECSPRECFLCGRLAVLECRDCFETNDLCTGLKSCTYCDGCFKDNHFGPKEKHRRKHFKNPSAHQLGRSLIPEIRMELFAVVCIETSHYVSFVKTGFGPDAPWCFFDSMADRKGEANGYNIPEMIALPDLPSWLSEDCNDPNFDQNEKLLPEHAKRLFCDAYMCMYQSTDVMMYR